MISTWVLVFYMSRGIAQTATGGPAAIDGFRTEAACKVALEKLSKMRMRGFDDGQCFEVQK